MFSQFSLANFTHFQTPYDLTIFKFLFCLTLVLLYYVYFRIDFYYVNAVRILHETVSDAFNQRVVSLELGIDRFDQYLKCEEKCAFRSPIFLNDDREEGWIVVLKLRSFPLFGTFLWVEVERVVPQAKRFKFELSVWGSDTMLFTDQALTKESSYMNFFNLGSLAKEDSPLNLRVRLDVTVKNPNTETNQRRLAAFPTPRFGTTQFQIPRFQNIFDLLGKVVLFACAVFALGIFLSILRDLPTLLANWIFNWCNELGQTLLSWCNNLLEKISGFISRNSGYMFLFVLAILIFYGQKPRSQMPIIFRVLYSLFDLLGIVVVFAFYALGIGIFYVFLRELPTLLNNWISNLSKLLHESIEWFMSQNSFYIFGFILVILIFCGNRQNRRNSRRNETYRANSNLRRYNFQGQHRNYAPNKNRSNDSRGNVLVGLAVFLLILYLKS